MRRLDLKTEKMLAHVEDSVGWPREAGFKLGPK